MRKACVRATVIAGAIGLGMTLGVGSAQAAGSASWQLAYRSHSATANWLNSVTAPSATDAWAVGMATTGSGNQPVILHWNGSIWAPVTIRGTAGFEPSSVESTSADNVWIYESGSPGPEALVWNGRDWGTVVMPGNLDGGAIAVVSSTDVWGIGAGTCSNDDCTTTLWHWDGKTWASTQLKGLAADLTAAGGHAWLLMLTSVQHLSTNPNGLPVIYESAGAQMQPVTSPTTRIGYSSGLTASPGGHLWLLGAPIAKHNHLLLFRWAGQSWTRSVVPAKVPGSSQLFIVDPDATYDGHNGIWAGPFAHWTGTRWLNTNRVEAVLGDDGYSLGAVAAIPGSTSVWSVGQVDRSPTNDTPDSLITVYGGLP